LSDLIRGIFDNSQKETISIKEEVEMLEPYLKLESMRFSKKIDYSFEVDEAILDNKISPFLLQPIVENSIWHGIMHKKGQGEIKITIKRAADNYIQCTVEDNGVGREKSAAINKTKQVLKKSSGIELTQKRLELLSWRKKPILMPGLKVYWLMNRIYCF
jgi:sensor histidine kinase YesM